MSSTISRRSFFVRAAIASVVNRRLSSGEKVGRECRGSAVRTVLGPVVPSRLGVTLMHEHAPAIDWSELCQTPPAPITEIREKMLSESVRCLDAFHRVLAPKDGPGAIVEVTPIRVGRYPLLLADLARKTQVHIVGSTGFWCEAMAPQHPWAVRMSRDVQGVEEMRRLFVREILQGMEDPRGAWGQRFTEIQAGIIKIGTSTHLRSSERVVHRAAAEASLETGCPITTHTTEGGGLEQARLLVSFGVQPEKVAIGHQGYQDDRENREAHSYHLRIADEGVSVQFDRVGHEKYPVPSQVRQIKHLLDRGHSRQILVSHDLVPFYYREFAAQAKTRAGWSVQNPDFTLIPTRLVEELSVAGVSDDDIRLILVENPARFLAF